MNDKFDSSSEEVERHQIYCYLVLALLKNNWNPWKKGFNGIYNWHDYENFPHKQYLGHNIACIGVHESGLIVDFDFNHNELFNSSIEHAESRLLRRLFSLTHHVFSPIGKDARIDKLRYIDKLKKQDPDLDIKNPYLWATIHDSFMAFSEHKERYHRSKSSNYGRALNGFTVYTSLESCAQCSGMMALGAVKEVVYLQSDPGQHNIGNILFNLNGKDTAFNAPKPIYAGDLGVNDSMALDREFKLFTESQNDMPFYVDEFEVDCPSKSITSFLCTENAYKIFNEGEDKLESFKLEYPDYCPDHGGDSHERERIAVLNLRNMTNEEVLYHAKDFLRSALYYGKRGTPH